MPSVRGLQSFSWRKPLRRAVERVTRKRLYKDARLEIFALPASGTSAVVVFGSLNGNSFDERRVELAGTATFGQRAAIFVRDLTQGWFQDARSAEAITATVRGYLKEQGHGQVLTTGCSMGGYGALAYAGDIGAGAALALAPQYDPSPEAVPEDPRWPAERGAIPDFSRGAIDRWLAADVDYFVLHGRQGADIAHWSRFPLGQNIHHYLIDGRNHDVPAWLKEQGKLQSCFELALSRDIDGFAALANGFPARRRSSRDTMAERPNAWARRLKPANAEGVTRC